MFKLYTILDKRYNKKNKLITFVFIITAVIFLISLAFSSGLKKIIDFPYKSDDLKEITIYPFNRYKYTNEIISENLEKNINNLTTINKMIIEYTTAIDNSYNIHFTNENYKINIVNQIKAFDFEYDIFSSKEENIEGLNNSIILGDYKAKRENGILIDENVLHLLNYNIDEIIGKKIKFSINEKEVFLEIIGVYDRRLGFGFFKNEDFKTKNKKYKSEFLDLITEDGLTNGFIFNKRFVINYIDNDPTNKNVKLEAKSLKDVINIHNMIENNSELLVNSSLGTINNYILENEKYSIIIAIILISVALSLLIFTILAINLRLIKQKMFIKMLNINGYCKKSILKIYLYDIFLNLFKITLIYSFIGMTLSFILDSNMRKIYIDFGIIEKNIFILDFFILLKFIIFHSIFHLLASTISCFLSINKIFKLEDISNDT